MKLINPVKVLVLGVFIHFVMTIAMITNAIANNTGGSGNIFNDGRMSFSDGQWTVLVGCGDAGGIYIDNKSNKSVRLSDDATITYKNGRRIYSWVQSGTKYKLTWNPKDPNFARLEVTKSSSGKVVNTLLKVSGDLC
jgi:hypothetical protein